LIALPTPLVGETLKKTCSPLANSKASFVYHLKTFAYSGKPSSIFGSALPSQYYVGVTLAQPTLPLHPGTNTVEFDTFFSYKAS